MTALSEMGAIIAPPVPAFYARPESLAEMVDHTIGRVLDLFDIDAPVSGVGGAEKADRAQPSSAVARTRSGASGQVRPRWAA